MRVRIEIVYKGAIDSDYEEVEDYAIMPSFLSSALKLKPVEKIVITRVD